MPVKTDKALILQASALIEQRTGLAASTQFRADLEGILFRLSDGDIAAFVNHLYQAQESDLRWQQLIAALTIGETYFFRDPLHFRLLKQHILPELIIKRREANKRALNIWSVGCATGEEPYSIAITLHELLPDLADWTLRLIGTDINAYALETAQQGIYRQWAFRQPISSSANGNFREHYFDDHPHGAHIKRHIQEMVSFRHSNLLNGSPLPQMDVIFCRNVLIYFKNVHVKMAEELLYEALSPGGWLILGQSEAIRFERERWVTHLFPGTAIYQKPQRKPTLPRGQFAYKQHAQPPLEITETKEVPVVRTTPPSYLDAVSALQRDEKEEAERYLSEILLAEPDHASAHTLLASIFASRRAWPEAQAHLDTTLRIDSLQPDAHYLQAMLYLDQGETAKAKKSLHAALYCQRNHPLAAFVLGNLFAQEGDITRATRAWDSARRIITNLKPDSPLSDMSDVTAGSLEAMLKSQLDGWEG